MKYSYLEKKLHNICLGNETIKKSLFEIENILFYKSIPVTNNNHVFITGLPRSGTTALLELIYSSNEFGSLTYRDMPFVISPNLFSKFVWKRKLDKKERMHSDGLFYDLDTPEAFEEVFFSTFSNDSNLSQKFQKYVQLVLIKAKKNKYLSKNNCNFKRIELLQNIFPKAKIVIPFREPLQQAYSMQRQHINFKNKQDIDSFIIKYTNYLGHREFGNNHLPWFEPVLYKDPKNINYWLEQWHLYYNNIFNKKLSNNCFIISYELLCENKKKQYAILEKLEISNKTNFDFMNNKRIIDEKFDLTIYNKCKELYRTLEEKFTKNV